MQEYKYESRFKTVRPDFTTEEVMAKRVEICGIDTGTLPKLSHEQTIDLLKKAQKATNQPKRNL